MCSDAGAGSDGGFDAGGSSFEGSYESSTSGSDSYEAYGGNENIGEGSYEMPDGDENIGEGSYEMPDGDENIGESSFETPDGDENIGESSFETPDGDENIGESSSEIPDGEEKAEEASQEEIHNSELSEPESDSEELTSVDDEKTEPPEETETEITEEDVENIEAKPEKIKCRNEGLAGSTHPETGVPFESMQVEVDGKQYEVVVPIFESSYDAQLPEDMYESPDRVQFKECNEQLKSEVENNEELRSKFDDEQLEQIENGETPDGLTWHHDAKAGKMQMVDLETHMKTAHTGGRYIWGGGTDKR